MTIGNSSHTTTGQPYQSSARVSVPLHSGGATPFAIPSMHIPSPPLLSTTPSVPFLDVPESHSNTNLATNLVKPSSFFVPPSPATMIAPVSSSMPSASLLQPAVSLQRPYGAPLLQPFPPPAPPPSLTPASFPASNFGTVINRDKVRDALRLLVQVSLSVPKLHSYFFILLFFLFPCWEDLIFLISLKFITGTKECIWKCTRNTL